MRIDWQAFDDGLMDSEQKRLADRALMDDPAAARELEGLRALKKAVRAAAMEEPIPRERLAKSLKAVVGTRRAPKLRLVWMTAAVLACSIVLALAANYFTEGFGDGEASARVDSAEEAQVWAREQSGLSLPAIDLAPIATIQSAHAHTGWACYDYDVLGQTVHVSITSGECGTTGYDPIQTKYGVIYNDKIGGVVRFTDDNLYYMVRGVDEHKRIEIAKRTLAEAATKNRMGKRPSRA